MAKPADQEFQQRVHKIESLIRDIDSLRDLAAQVHVKDLVQALLDLHGTGLERMLDVMYQTGAAGEAIIDDLAKDELVSALLLLHGLHPFSLQERVHVALDKVRPYMKSHGGNVEVLGVTEDGVVRLRLEGTCNGCASSRVTLKYAVEEAIYAAAPDVSAIETEGAVEAQPARPSGFIPMSELMEQAIATTLDRPPAKGNGASWVEVETLTMLQEGAQRVIQVSGLPVFFCRVGENYYAYGNTCPNCRQLLGQARLMGKDLACLACGHHYDVMRAGRDVDDHNLHLEPFPLLQEQGQIKIALHH